MPENLKKPYFYMVLISIIAALAGVLIGYDAGVIADTKDLLTKRFVLSDNEWSLIASTSILGALIGLPICGFLSNFISRNLMLISVAVGFIIGMLLTATATSITAFIFGRFIIGISIGIGSFTAPLLISEIAPTKLRGTLILINSIAITSGQALSFLIGYLLHDISAQSWRIIIWIEFIPAIFLLLGMLIVPQSPRWIALKHGIEKAHSVLKLIRHDTNAITTELNEIASAIHASKQNTLLKHIFSKHLISVLLIGILLGIFQQFSGISTIMFYGPVIFETSGFSTIKYAIFATFLISLVNLFATFLSMFLVDRFGRRPLLIYSSLITAISLFLIGLAHLLFAAKWLTFIFLVIYIISYCIGLGSLFWVVISEIYPLRVRGFCMSLASAAATCANMLVTATFLQIVNAFGLQYAFWIYSFFSILACIYIWYRVPETKGISLELIEKHLKSKA